MLSLQSVAANGYPTSLLLLKSHVLISTSFSKITVVNCMFRYRLVYGLWFSMSTLLSICLIIVTSMSLTRLFYSNTIKSIVFMTSFPIIVFSILNCVLYKKSVIFTILTVWLMCWLFLRMWSVIVLTVVFSLRLIMSVMVLIVNANLLK